MTVRELLARIDSSELSEWIKYFELEPFGPVRSDLSAGIVAATIANVNKGKSGKAFQPVDFMPFLGQGEQSEDDMMAILQSMAGGNNGDSR